MHYPIKTFTVALGQDLSPAAALGMPCARLIWTLSPEGRLIRTARPLRRGGLLGFYLSEGSAAAEPSFLATALWEQAMRFGCTGFLLDLPEDEAGYALACTLSPRLTRSGLPVYLPISLAPADGRARLILPSAISGGTFDEMLRTFTERYPPHRLCLELVRTRHDFPMPAPDPEGTLLTAAQFEDLLKKAGGSYFSPDLCARYFTYKHEDGKPHFVLFDDAASASVKLQKAADAGFHAAFALYAEWGTALKDICGI